MIRRLLKRLHRVFRKKPGLAAVISVTYDGTCTLTVKNLRLICKSAAPLNIDISTITISELIEDINGEAGYTATLLDATFSGYLARGLYEVENQDVAESLLYPTNPLYNEFQVYAWELQQQFNQLTLAEKQLYLATSTGSWLDFWGGRFGVKRYSSESDASYSNRIIHEISRPTQNNIALANIVKETLGLDVQVIDAYPMRHDMGLAPVGAAWTQRATREPTKIYHGLAWNGTMFLATPYTSEPTNFSDSTNGVTWTLKSPPSTTNGYWMTAGSNYPDGNQFCLIESVSRKSYVTSDCVTYTSGDLPGPGFWDTLVWNGSFYCLSQVSNSQATTMIATSPDGITWTGATLANRYWREIASDGTNFVIASTTKYVSHFNPVTRVVTEVALPDAGETGFTGCILWDGSRYICLGLSWVYTSTDGLTWSQLQPATLLTSQSINKAIKCGNEYVGILRGAITTRAATSPDGVNWTPRALPASTLWWYLAYGANRLVALPQSGDGILATSIKGVSWAQVAAPTFSADIFKNRTGITATRFTLATGATAICVLFSGSAEGAVTVNGTDWTLTARPTATTNPRIAFSPGLGLLCAVGEGYSKAQISSDGMTWTEVQLPQATVTGLMLVAANATNKLSIVATGEGYMFISTDGTAWTERALCSVTSAVHMVYGPGVAGMEQLLAMNDAGAKGVTNDDGTSWLGGSTPANPAFGWTALHGSPTRYMAACATHFAYSTMNGSWTQIALPIAASWVAIALASGRYYLLADDGTTLMSLDGATWDKVDSVAIESGSWSALVQGFPLSPSLDGVIAFQAGGSSPSVGFTLGDDAGTTGRFILDVGVPVDMEPADVQVAIDRCKDIVRRHKAAGTDLLPYPLRTVQSQIEVQNQSESHKVSIATAFNESPQPGKIKLGAGWKLGTPGLVLGINDAIKEQVYVRVINHPEGTVAEAFLYGG